MPITSPSDRQACSRPTPCDGCALTPGAAASLEPWNAVRARIAAQSGTPFYCHEGLNWRDPLEHAPRTKAEWRAKMLRPCRGWQREVAALAASGWFRDPTRRIFVRAIGEAALAQLETWHATTGRAAKRRAWRVLEDLVTRLLTPEGWKTWRIGGARTRRAS